MKKCRVQLEVILEIDVDEQDEEKALAIAEETAFADLYNNYTSECVLDNAPEGIYMVSAGVRAIDCEEVDYE